MTFRPSDDILEEISANAQSSNISENYNDSQQWDHLFRVADDTNQFWDSGNSDSNEVNTLLSNEPIEEVKAPDLSELLKNGEMNDSNISVENDVIQDEQAEQDFSIDLSGIQSVNSQDSENNQENISHGEEIFVEQNDTQNWEVKKDPLESPDESVSIDGKLGDDERANFVSEVEWSVHSNLDFLVDEQWMSVVKNYNKMHRIIFRRWIFIITAVLWIFAWVFAQVKINPSGNTDIINQSSIYDINRFSNEYVLTNFPGWDNEDINLVIPYGVSKINWNELLTKSNLVSYKWIILPQTASIDVNSDDIISLEDFENKEVTREDLEAMVDVLVANDSLNRKLKTLPNISDYKWQWQRLQGWLMDDFNLWCMFTTKVSNEVCDKFLDIFYKYWKYYNLSSFETDLLKLVKEIKKQNKSVGPVCDMVKEYVLHSGVTPSDVLGSVMNYCDEDDQLYYKKLVKFIEVENSLWQPELSNKVFDDPDLNAYKLLSAQQYVYKILEGTSINKNFIINYLNFVQNLVNKDKWTHDYLAPLYMDELYVFNMDELYDKLLKRGELSSDLKSQIDQINNGNFLMKQESLLSHLTTPNIIVSNGEFTGSVVSNKTLEDIFAQYYSMTDHLRIRKVGRVSDTQLKVQAEIFSDGIYAVVGDTLKATVSLYRRDNILYVEKISIANQLALSDILNVYASSSLVTFYAMIWYIDEQVWFWYEAPAQETELQKSFCEILSENEDLAVYNCDDSNVLIYTENIEYNFTLKDGILESFNVSDEELNSAIKSRFGDILSNRDNTPTIITSILWFKLDKPEENNIEEKLQVINQFRIHLKLVPNVYDIEWEDDIFMVEFTLWDEFTLQARYNVDTHLLTRISYIQCGKTLEIRNLTIEVSANNEAELTELLNNPRIFLTKANQAAFKKYQRMCDEDKEEDKK